MYQEAIAGEQEQVSESGPAPAWLAVWTRSRHEAAVRDQLATRGIETFLPTITRWSQWKDRRRRIDWPLFPGYCFVRIAPDQVHRLARVAGVVSVVSFDGRPAEVDEVELTGIRRLVESELRFDPCPLIREGDLVEVVRGPLKGIAGRLVRKQARARLIVAMSLLSRGVEVEIDAADVRPH